MILLKINLYFLGSRQDGSSKGLNSKMYVQWFLMSGLFIIQPSSDSFAESLYFNT